MYVVRVRRVGSSLIITLPRDVCAFLELKERDFLVLEKANNATCVISKAVLKKREEA